MYNWELIKQIVKKDVEAQKQKEIQNQREEEYKFSISTTDSSSSVRTTTTYGEGFPKINPQDIPNETELKYKYRIERYIGSGQFGDVYLSSSRQRFAVKTFKEQPTEQDLIEISIMKGIKSQYICELHDYYRSQDGKYNIVQEYAQFGDLLNYCKNTLQWNVLENLAKEWLTSIVLGLKELHSKGIIHRDIKPDNILVFKKDEVRIADYGQAKTMGESRSKRLYGTQNYISPEMLKGKDYDFSTDIYSLGVTFIYLLTRKYPTEDEIKDPNWQPKVDGFSEEFTYLLRRMVSYDSNERPSVVDLIFDPVIADSNVMKEYRKIYGIMSLGFANFKPDSMNQLSEQGVGCKNCTLVLCNVCFRKKVESSFLMLNDMLGHADDINIKIQELVNDAQVELDVCQQLCPYVDTSTYSKILDNSQKMIDDSKKNQALRTEVQQLIKDFEPQIIQTSNEVIQNAKKILPELVFEDNFKTIVKNVKSSKNEKIHKFIDQFSAIQQNEDGKKIVIQQNLINNSIPKALKRFTTSDFRYLSYQTIHKLNKKAEYSMLATNKGLSIGGSVDDQQQFNQLRTKLLFTTRFIQKGQY
eukprot:403368597